jgi:hypothetical protein
MAMWNMVKKVDTRTSSTTLERPATALTVGIALFAAYHLALAALMAFAPHYFFTNIGPFGIRNDHYTRDLATYNAAIGAGLLVAVRRRSWRVPLLAVVTLQFALHSLNHLIDIDAAHPSWNGYFDFFSLAIATVVLAWLWKLAARMANDPLDPLTEDTPQAGRSPSTSIGESR